MEILVDVFLPLSLAVIMFSLGIGLTPADFRLVVQRPRAFAIGALCQVALIPIVAYVVVLAFGLTGALAAGVMLLSFCPGGLTTNMITRLANGDVALSVSLTAVISLLSIITVPPLVSWAIVHFMGTEAPQLTIANLAIIMFLLTFLPVVLGIIVRQLATDFAIRAEPKMAALSTLLFLTIIVAAVASEWTTFLENLNTLGPALATLIVIMMGGSLLVGAVAGLNWADRKTISIEVGIQNGTLGIALAAIIAGTNTGIPTIGLPAAVYGVLAYVICFPIVIWMRQK